MARSEKAGTIRYLAHPANLTVHLCGEAIQAKNGLISLTEKEVEELEMLISEHNRLDLKVALRRIDTKETEEAVKAHQAAIAAKARPAAIQGAITSESPAIDQEVREIDLEAHSQTLQPAEKAGEVVSTLRGRTAARG